MTDPIHPDSEYYKIWVNLRYSKWGTKNKTIFLLIENTEKKEYGLKISKKKVEKNQKGNKEMWNEQQENIWRIQCCKCKQSKKDAEY